MTKIKVAFFAEILIQDFDGASRTMFQLITRIPKEHFEFCFFCGVPPDQDLGFKVVELPTITTPFNKGYKAVFPYFSKQKIHQKLADFQPDIIHIATPSPLGNVAADYATQHEIPIISIYHTHFITYMKYYFRKIPRLLPFVYKKSVKLIQQFYDKVDLVYVPSLQIIDELQTICNIDAKKLKLWQRGLDNTLFHPSKRDADFITSIVQNKHPIILFASRIVWEKNLQQLIDLYQLCQDRQLPYNFVVAGDGVARKAAEAAMPKAHFLGMLDHQCLAKVYASSDVYFFPSDTESFGNVVVEAMASGLPCVVANGGGPKGFIQDGKNGFLCPVNDTDYYLEKIELLLHESKIRQQMIREGLVFTETLNWERLAAVYFEDLKQLAKNEHISIQKKNMVRK